MKTFRAAALAALALAASGHAAAATFTDDALFSTALAGMTIGVETFATLPVGTIINSGDRVNDITYDFFLIQGGTKAVIVDCAFGHCLSKENASAFFTGDRLQFSFATPVNAVGVVRASGFNTDYFNLTSNGASPEVARNFPATQGNFLGIVSPMAFTSVVFQADGPFECCQSRAIYTIPAIVFATAVPEPQPYLLLAAGLLVLAWPARRRA